MNARGITLFAVIDQRAEAQKAGLDLRETRLVIFDNPVQGTPVMAAAPLAALDLPLKVVVWADGDQTKVSAVAAIQNAYLGPLPFPSSCSAPPFRTCGRSDVKP